MSKFSNYLKGVVKEGKRVRWPKGAELWTNVAVVLVVVTAAAGFLALDDFISTNLLSLLEEAFKNF